MTTTRTRPEGLVRGHLDVIGVVAVGGALGAAGRYGLAQCRPIPIGEFPWATLVTNLTGCFAIGVVMVFVERVWSGRRLVRPFLGVGLLGGYTTFSTYAVDIGTLFARSRPVPAVLYLIGTPIGALLATTAAIVLTRWLLGPREKR